MKFGNWNISDTTIEWSGNSIDRFVIDRDTLLEKQSLENADEQMYKWIVVATGEECLTVDDLYDLNFAFVFAAASKREEFEYEVFDKSLEYQFDMLDEEEEEE